MFSFLKYFKLLTEGLTIDSLVKFCCYNVTKDMDDLAIVLTYSLSHPFCIIIFWIVLIHFPCISCVSEHNFMYLKYSLIFMNSQSSNFIHISKLPYMMKVDTLTKCERSNRMWIQLWAGLASCTRPGYLHRALHLEGPNFGLLLCCCYLEILYKFWKRDFTFSCYIGPCKRCSWFCYEY